MADSEGLFAASMASSAVHIQENNKLREMETRIADLMQRSLMLVTALAPAIGYDNAAAIAKAAKRAKRDVLVHTDAAQSFGKVCVNVKELGVDLCTLVG